MTDIAPSGPGWVDLTKKPSFVSYMRDVWRRRDMAVEIARNSLKSEHVDSALGELWFLLNPLMSIGVYWLVFGVVMGTDRGVTNFVGFLAVGVFTFDLSRGGLLRSTRSMISNRGLMTALRFPRALIPLAVTLEQSYNFLPQIAVAAGILLLTGEPVRLAWVMVPVMLALQTLFTLGAGLFVARLGHHAHDTKNALPFVLRLVFYLSGILFSMHEFASGERVVDKAAEFGISEFVITHVNILNPFHSFVTMARHYMLASQPSPYPVSWLWLTTGAWTLLLLFGGLWFFRGAELDYGRD